MEKELTGKNSEPSDLIYFKVYKSQIPVIEQAIESAALMLGSDKSRGNCLEMICADFRPGHTWTAATQRCCCIPFHATTISFPAHNGRSFCRRSTGRLHEEQAPRQEPAT